MALLCERRPVNERLETLGDAWLNYYAGFVVFQARESRRFSFGDGRTGGGAPRNVRYKFRPVFPDTNNVSAPKLIERSPLGRRNHLATTPASRLCPSLPRSFRRCTKKCNEMLKSGRECHSTAAFRVRIWVRLCPSTPVFLNLLQCLWLLIDAAND